jgi:ribosomal-protein-alanine N-acetyltransferase
MKVTGSLPLRMLNGYYYQDKLESQRLITRFITPDDVRLWAPFFDDPHAVQYIPTFGVNTKEELSPYWIDRQLTRYRESRYGLQLLLDKSSGICIGQSGLLTQEVDGLQELEVSYHVIQPYRGHGYAPEAARLFMAFAFVHNLADSVISIIDTRNSNSIRVAEKNGLRREKLAHWMGLEVYIYRMYRQDFHLS